MHVRLFVCIQRAHLPSNARVKLLRSYSCKPSRSGESQILCHTPADQPRLQHTQQHCCNSINLHSEHASHQPQDFPLKTLLCAAYSHTAQKEKICSLPGCALPKTVLTARRQGACTPAEISTTGSKTGPQQRSILLAVRHYCSLRLLQRTATAVHFNCKASLP